MKKEIKDILNMIDENIYITDPNTDEIVFVNQKMKDAYHLKDSVGKICWKVFQNNQEGRCEFCKIPELLKNKEKKIYWREHNEVLNDTFDNCDFLIDIDNKQYHIQSSREMNQQLALHKKATYDEISGVYNHATGKEMLYQIMNQEHPSFSIALINIDHMRSINEQYGRKEGDHILRTFASYISSNIDENEFIYHYSGDEFVIVFYRNPKEVKEYLDNAEVVLKKIFKEEKKPFIFSFTSGVTFVPKDAHDNLNQLLVLADEQMYEKKLRAHRSNVLEEKDNVLNTSLNFSSYFNLHFNQLFDAISNSTDDFIFLSDLDTGVFRYDPSLVAYLNMPGELIENPLPFWKKIIHPEDWNKFYVSNMQIIDRKINYHSIAFRVMNAKNEYVWLKCRGRVIPGDQSNPTLFAGILALMGKQNHIDPLTQIPNQVQFSGTVKYKLTDTSLDSLSIMLINIDDFRTINELYKREFGDDILKEVAHLFQSVLHDSASLYRIEKDQFAVLYLNATNQQLQELYDDFCEVLLKSYVEKTLTVSFTISAGSATYPMDCDNYEMLLEYCETALQHSKENGKAQLTIFTPEILTDKHEKLQLMKQLSDSIRQNFERFELYYQPQVEAQTQHIKGVEVLLRWRNEEGNMVPPSIFIPVLEEYDYIKTVTLWIFKQALTDGKEWLKINPDFMISINISVLHLLEDDFYESILNILFELHFPIQNIILEITESTTAQNIYVLKNRLAYLQKLGFHIALDDFGTGYSSLNILRSSPFDIIKIDKSFVSNLETNAFNSTFIQFISNIVHNANMKVCLEGIETMEQYHHVLPMNLDYIQGYLFGKPVPKAEITPLLKKSA